MRHLTPAPRLPRMRLQDPYEVLRNGIHPPGIRRHQQQAQGKWNVRSGIERTD